MFIPVDSLHQIECMTEAIFFESRGEPLQGQLLVAQVIKNRVLDKKFPKNYCDVIHQKHQFSYKFRRKTFNSDLKSKRKAAIVSVVSLFMPRLMPMNVLYYTTSEAKYFQGKKGFSKYSAVGHHTFYASN